MKQEKIFSSVDQIKGKLGMSQQEAEKLSVIVETYPMAVPEYYLSLIDPDDPEDPIRKMCIPSVSEMNRSGEIDTSGEADNTVALGLQHKYPQTVLILSTTTARCIADTVFVSEWSERQKMRSTITFCRPLIISRPIQK